MYTKLFPIADFSPVDTNTIFNMLKATNTISMSVEMEDSAHDGQAVIVMTYNVEDVIKVAKAITESLIFNHIPLTSIQYNVIMQAIDNSKAEIADDTFIDPYAENLDNYTNESLLQALNEVQNKILIANIPR